MNERATTESRNPRSEAIDDKSSLEIVDLMNSEDDHVVAAVATQRIVIARAIDVIADRIARGGRLIYVGAGTSGRLGVLDASECPPTFRTEPWQVVGLIAGGTAALTRSIEGAEDHPQQARDDLAEMGLSAKDVVVGIATSGRTPYVLGALKYAREVDATAIGLSCNRDSQLAEAAEFCIVPVVGPEVISGSTRLKAGTATKMVLNMLTTGAMVRNGKTFGNLMVDLRATNEKLVHRARSIVCDATGLDPSSSVTLLEACGGEVKTALVCHFRAVSADTARTLLAESGGHLRRVIGPANPAAQEQSDARKH